MIAALVLLVLVACGVAAILLRDLARGLRDLGRERSELADQVQELGERLADLEDHSRRQGEDLLVLTHVILERGVADEDDMEDIRHRCVEVPLRRAEERDALLRNAGVDLHEVIVDDDEASSVH
jgi:hypothetical protein